MGGLLAQPDQLLNHRLLFPCPSCPDAALPWLGRLEEDSSPAGGGFPQQPDMAMYVKPK
jgi:hypothetical protein